MFNVRRSRSKDIYFTLFCEFSSLPPAWQTVYLSPVQSVLIDELHISLSSTVCPSFIFVYHRFPFIYQLLCLLEELNSLRNNIRSFSEGACTVSPFVLKPLVMENSLQDGEQVSEPDITFSTNLIR